MQLGLRSVDMRMGEIDAKKIRKEIQAISELDQKLAAGEYKYSNREILKIIHDLEEKKIILIEVVVVFYICIVTYEQDEGIRIYDGKSI